MVFTIQDLKFKREKRLNKKENVRKDRIFNKYRSKFNSIEKGLMERTSQRHRVQNNRE